MQISCKKDSDSGANTSGSILGKWNATLWREKFVPSQGNDEYEPYDTNKPVNGITVEFKSDGTVIECYGSQCYTYYYKKENNNVIFSESANFSETWTTQINTLTSNKLDLYYKEFEVAYGTYEEWRSYTR